MFGFGTGIFHSLRNKTQSSFTKCSNLFSTTSSLTNMILLNLKKFNPNPNILKNDQTSSILPQIEQIRHGSYGYKGRMMLKDIKRRELLRKFAPERVRLQTLRANSILPRFFRVIECIICF